jgi:hypothetical protein
VLNCVLGAENSLLTITGGATGTFRNAAEQRLGRLRAELEYANINEIIEGGLHEFIDAFQTELNGVGEGIFDTFFAVETLPSETASRSVAEQGSLRRSPDTDLLRFFGRLAAAWFNEVDMVSGWIASSHTTPTCGSDAGPHEVRRTGRRIAALRCAATR